MKRKLALLTTGLALLLVVKFAQRQAPITASSDDTPMACVERMFAAATRADLATYMKCFSGVELEAIQRSIDQESESAAAESLRKTVTDLKGWAVVDPPLATSESFQCSLVLERIYTGRIDRQKLDLDRVLGRWKICRVERPQPIHPAVVYGTPISEEIKDESSVNDRRGNQPLPPGEVGLSVPGEGNP